MKKMKKIMCLMLAVVLVLGMSMTVFAADDDPATGSTQTTFTIKAPATTDSVTHTYEVYQIFTGDLFEKDGKKTLSNIKWGLNGKGTVGQAVDANVLTALEAVAAEATNDDKAQLAVIEGYVNFNSTAYKTVTSGNTLTGVPAGYYLIKDKDNSLIDDEGNPLPNTAYTLNIVQVVGDVAVQAKSDKPTVDKKVQENSTKEWDVVADYNIGDHVSFELIGTLPSNYDMYDAYKYVFHDTLSEGLTLDAASVKVYKVTGDIPKEEIPEGNLIDTTNYTITSGEHSLEVSFNVTKNGDAYTDKGLKDVVDQYDANTKIVVRYTATLNKGAVIGLTGNLNKVTLEYSNNPNSDGDGDTGETPEEKVVVFTFEIDGNKVDGKDSSIKLAGAKFKLYRGTGDNKEYVVIEDSKVSSWTKVEADGTILETTDEGKFIFSGLDAGTYYLEEIEAPKGYNKLDGVVTVVITPGYNTTTANGTLITLNATITLPDGTSSDVDGRANDGTISGKINFDVENNGGSTLPETGGIGTTIFYVLGGILVLCCGVVLIAKKRVSKEF